MTVLVAPMVVVALALAGWGIWHEVQQARKSHAMESIAEEVGSLPHVESVEARYDSSYFSSTYAPITIRMSPDAVAADAAAAFTTVSTRWGTSALSEEQPRVSVFVDGPAWSGGLTAASFDFTAKMIAVEVGLWEQTSRALGAGVGWDLSTSSTGLDRRVISELPFSPEGPDSLQDRLAPLRSLDGLETVETLWDLRTPRALGGAYDTFSAFPTLPDDATFELWRGLSGAVPAPDRAGTSEAFAAYPLAGGVSFDITYTSTELSDTPGDFSAGSIWAPTAAQLDLLGAHDGTFSLTVNGSVSRHLTIASDPGDCEVGASWADAQQALLAQAGSPQC